MAAFTHRNIPKNIEAVFFDLYGTLLIYGNMSRAWTDWFLSVYNSFQEYGLSKTKDEFAEICDSFFEKPEPPVADDKLTVFERRIQRLAVETDLYLRTFEIKETVAAAVQAWHQYISVDPEAITTLKELKRNKTLGLITNFDHPPHIYSQLAKEGLNDFFDVVTISGEIGLKKPDTKIFLHTLKRVNLQPGQVVYIGDTADDIIGANRAGLIPILIQRDISQSSLDGIDFRSKNSETENIKNKLSIIAGTSIIRRLSELLNTVF